MESDFGKIRSLFWPIRRHELSRFVPMMLLFFLIAFNYHILKILKDTLIITAPQSGAETIPFLKVWAILPSAILLTFLFTKLSSKLNRENIFYVVMSVFLGFFALFIFVIYPNIELFNLNSTADMLATKLPLGFKGFISIIRYWHFSLFYIMAESWSTIMLSLLLWIFIVDVLSIDQAKRYYAFFGVSRNSAGILCGFLGQYLAAKSLSSNASVHFLSKFCGAKTPWDQTLLIFIVTALVCGVCIMTLYRYLHVYKYPKRYLLGGDINKKGKQNISFVKSILYTVKSKYVLYISLLVLCYNILINLVEVLWKSQIKELYPGSSAFTAFTSKVTLITGVVAVISSFFISGNLIRRLGWRVTALVTPIALIVSAFGFFYFVFVKKFAENSNVAITLFGLSPLVLAVLFGAVQDIFSRSLKYTVFDDTKEMAFIPLSAEEKLQSKSAIDGIGSRLGKSGSSLIMQILFMIFITPMGASPIIFGIVILIFPIWIIAINRLSKQFEEKTKLLPKPEREASEAHENIEETPST
ncbi:MAG: ADP,ATP carrier protein 1 [Candidatus Anoxychlamydiales bacterium]|nr:ADP,ATP carrier protein 1 [Candidatus Anoxychlamydiales bacterium]